MKEPFEMASQSGSRPPGHGPGRETPRERAEALRREGLGYKAIARRLDVSRDRVRAWLRPRPRCPECGGPMSVGSKRCRACRLAAGVPSTRISLRLSHELADAFRALCRAEGRSVAEAVGELVSRRVAAASNYEMEDSG